MMHQVARGWFVYELTESALDLAFVLVSFTIPQVMLSLIGGVVADRYPKRAIMAIAQSLNGIATLVMGYLVLTARVEFFHFLVFGLLNGSILALSFPARSSIIPALVESRLVFSAIALNSTAMNIARVVGPALAGLLIAWIAGGDTSSNIGVGVVFFVIAGLYILTAFITASISVSGTVVGSANSTNVFADMVEALKFVRRHPTVWALVWLAIIPFMFGHSVNSFLPAFNEDVMQGGPEDLGLLLSCMGIGAILGSLTLAAGSHLENQGRWLIGGIFVWGLATLIFAVTPNAIAALIAITVIGWVSSACMALNRALTQRHTHDRLLGRVMSIDMMAHGMMPFAAIPIGILADSVGTAFAIGSSGFSLLVLITLMLLLSPTVRHVAKPSNSAGKR